MPREYAPNDVDTAATRPLASGETIALTSGQHWLLGGALYQAGRASNREVGYAAP